jgi:hypothetical protein
MVLLILKMDNKYYETLITEVKRNREEFEKNMTILLEERNKIREQERMEEEKILRIINQLLQSFE